MACVAFAAVSLTACSDDDGNSYPDGNAPVVVNAIYLEDADGTVKDRPVDFARLGQTIRLEGSGFGGTRHVLVNGYDTYFNTTLVTDRNMVLQLAATTPILSADPEYRNKIVFVKDGGAEYSCDLIIRAAMPSITVVDNTLPRPGELVIVRGTNLQEIVKVTLPGNVEVTTGIVSDEDGEWFSFRMPEGVTESGSIQADGANGTAFSPEYFNFNNCYIIDWDDLGLQGSWGQTYGSGDLVDDPLGTGRGKVVQLIPQVEIDKGGIASGARTLLWATAGNDFEDDDWSRMLKYIPGETPAKEVAIQFDVYVPGEWDKTGQFQIGLQNNLSTYGYGGANTKFSDQYTNTAALWIPWLNEDGTTTPYTTGERWQTISIPLSKFGNYNSDKYSIPDPKADDENYSSKLEEAIKNRAKADAATFQKVIDDRNSGSYRNFVMVFCNSDLVFNDNLTLPASATSQLIYIDNIRIVPYKAPVVSDFPDEEE